MSFIKNFMRGNYGLLKTFLLSHVALLCYWICTELIVRFMPKRRGELDDAYAGLYFIAVLELLAIYLLLSFWNAIKKYDGRKAWVYMSMLYALFVSQCILLPLYILGYLVYLSEPMK